MLIERERACDDLVLSASPRGGAASAALRTPASALALPLALTPADYAQHLLDAARTLRAPRLTRPAGPRTPPPPV